MADTQPETAKPARVKPAVRFHAIVGAIPAISLGVGFWLLIFQKVPADNKEIVLAIGSGLLGYLTHAAQTHKPSDPSA